MKPYRAVLLFQKTVTLEEGLNGVSRKTAKKYSL